MTQPKVINTHACNLTSGFFD